MENNKLLAVVRIRGRVGVRKDIAETLERLRLKRVNNCVIIKPTPSYTGMLNSCINYVTYGEIDDDTLNSLLEKNGIKSDYKTLSESGLAKEVREKLPFRLHPPRRGYKSVKKSVKNGGSLGYMGEGINSLIKRTV